MELLSPAGSFDALRAAVQNGADAVYLAGNSFGARRSAKNFDDEELERAIAYAHVRGVKVYITVNTLIHDAEMEQALFFLHFLYRIGADAVIVQDPAIGVYVLKNLPGMHVHASTQMAIHDANGVKMLENLGFHRVVLARELSQKEMRAIRRNTKIELEVFGHGALCESCSGQCLMSSFLGGGSGNRGACAQPCRLPYELYNGEKKIASGHLLSPKDLSLADKLWTIEPDLIDSLKIEGRLKSPQYVGAVTKIYRKYLDHHHKLCKEDFETLMAAFNRSGFTDGYFTGKLGREMMSYEIPGNRAGETILSSETKRFLKDIDQSFREDANFRKVPVGVHAVLKAGQPLQITLQDREGRTGRAAGKTLPEPAQKVEMDAVRLENQACRLGNTVFEADHFTCDLENGLSLPVSEINAVRRAAAESLEEERKQISPVRREIPFRPFFHDCSSGKERRGLLTVSVETKEQLYAVSQYEFARLYVPASLLEEANNMKLQAEIVLRCPDIIPEQVPKSGAVLVGNLGYFSLAGECRIYGDFRLNAFNRSCVDFYQTLGASSVTLSMELTGKEMNHIANSIDLPLECVVYGRAPLMLLRNCPFRAWYGSCRKDCSKLYLKDRMGVRFDKLCDHQVCTLLNAKPVYVADVLEKAVPKLDYLRLSFTLESGAECQRVIEEYHKAVTGKRAGNPFGENQFTRGHFIKGVQ